MSTAAGCERLRHVELRNLGPNPKADWVLKLLRGRTPSRSCAVNHPSLRLQAVDPDCELAGVCSGLLGLSLPSSWS